jgi:hypothetical protein
VSTRLLAPRLLALCAAGWLVFDFPLLGIWPATATLWGLPLRPLALFAAWGLLIAVLAWLMETHGD